MMRRITDAAIVIGALGMLAGLLMLNAKVFAISFLSLATIIIIENFVDKVKK